MTDTARTVDEHGFPVNPGDTAATPATAPADGTPVTEDAMAQALTALTAAMQANANPVADNAEPTASTATPNTSEGLNVLDPATIEDPILRSMAVVMKTVGHGLDMNRVFGKALDHGDPALIDAPYLREKGGTNAEQLVEIAKSIVQAVEAKSVAVTKAVHDLVGGEQNWSAAVTAFNAKAPTELRAVVAQMLDSRKESFIVAGAKLVSEFSKASGLVPVTGQHQAFAAAGAVQALSKEEFQAELRKLDSNSRTYQQDRNALFARRKVGASLGK